MPESIGHTFEVREFVLALWGTAFLVTFFGCIPYLIWVIRTAIRKNWKKLGYQIGVPIVAFLVLAGVSEVENSFAQKRYFEELFGVKGEFGTPLFKYDSDRSFTGDGNSIVIYELPPSIRARFESADGKLLNEFPKRSGYPDGWEAVSWRESPMEDRFAQYRNFALSNLGRKGGSEISNHFEAIRQSLSQSGNFYAFFHYDRGDYPGNIDFFVVDLKGSRLYLINLDT